MPTIYAAGPISGQTHDECTEWRDDLAHLLRAGIKVASPMRNKEYLKDSGSLEGDYPEHVMSTQKGIMTRDHNDVAKCDLIIANLAGVKRPSLGTVMELAWAFAYGKPVVAVMEDAGNPHEHPMIRETIGFRVTTLEDAAKVANSILGPYIQD